MPSIQSTVEINGVTYDAELGTVERTNLGTEDHGIFAANISFKFPGSGQGTGHYSLDTYDKEKGERVPTASGLGWIQNLIKVISGEYGQWEKLAGKRVWILREEGRGFGSIVGLMNADDSSSYFIFKDFWDAQVDEKSVLGVDYI